MALLQRLVSTRSIFRSSDTQNPRIGYLVRVGVLVALLVAVLSNVKTRAAFPGQNGKIAFSSNRTGDQEVYVMDALGGNVVRLTFDPSRDENPSFSGDGTRIAFDSQRDGNFEIYVMNADGTNPVRLTNNPAHDVAPAFSPDGSRIVFESTRDGGSEVYTVNINTGVETRLTTNLGDNHTSAWSPDGTKIAFHSRRDGNPEVYVMNADGTNQTRLTNNPAEDTAPNFNPDGSQIVFASDRDGNFEIYVMNADGTNPTRLTNTLAQEHYPAFSPEGGSIVFMSDRDGNPEVYVMRADGQDVRRLTNHPAVDTFPDWQPSFSFLSFPLRNKTAFTAKITSVFDHSMSETYCPDGIVTAYTGEQGSSLFNADFVGQFKDCGGSRGLDPVYGFCMDATCTPFSVGGQYTGGGDPRFLYYDGHPGYDYRTTDQDFDGTLCPGATACNPSGKTEVLAAAAGTVVCVRSGEQRVEGCSEGPGEVKIDHGNGYFSIYLHLSRIDARAGGNVTEGGVIGTSGAVGSRNNPHLHFEVRRNVGGVLVPVDPYGWEGASSDPYSRAVNVRLWK